MRRRELAAGHRSAGGELHDTRADGIDVVSPTLFVVSASCDGHCAAPDLEPPSSTPPTPSGEPGLCAPNAECNGLESCVDRCYGERCCDLGCNCDTNTGRLSCSLTCN